MVKTITRGKDANDWSFNVKISNYANPENVLYDGCIKISEMDCTFTGLLMNTGHLKDGYDNTKINKIRRNLSCNVAGMIMDIYNTDVEDEYED